MICSKSKPAIITLTQKSKPINEHVYLRHGFKKKNGLRKMKLYARPESETYKLETTYRAAAQLTTKLL